MWLVLVYIAPPKGIHLTMIINSTAVNGIVIVSVIVSDISVIIWFFNCHR